MKKTMVIVVALLFLLGFTSFTFAQEKKHKAARATQESLEIIRGKVVSVDQANKQIVVKDNKTQADRNFMVSEKAIQVVKVGDEVKVKVKVGGTQAEGVKIIKQ